LGGGGEKRKKKKKGVAKRVFLVFFNRIGWKGGREKKGKARPRGLSRQCFGGEKKKREKEPLICRPRPVALCRRGRKGKEGQLPPMRKRWRPRDSAIPVLNVLAKEGEGEGRGRGQLISSPSKQSARLRGETRGGKGKEEKGRCVVYFKPSMQKARRIGESFVFTPSRAKEERERKKKETRPYP